MIHLFLFLTMQKPELKHVQTDAVLPIATVQKNEGVGSHLPKLTTNPKSAYFSADGEPVTSGEYAQRVKNLIAAKRSFSPWPQIGMGKRWPAARAAIVLAFGVFFALYSSNAVSVWSKEAQIKAMIKYKNELIERKQILLNQ